MPAMMDKGYVDKLSFVGAWEGLMSVLATRISVSNERILMLVAFFQAMAGNSSPITFRLSKEHLSAFFPHLH